MNEIATWRKQGAIALLLVNEPAENVMTARMLSALIEAVRRAEGDAEVEALVIACIDRTFFAGADFEKFGDPSAEPLLHEVVDAIEASQKPIVAAIHGDALGGGLEIAMACHHRIAKVGSVFGFPGVKAGHMPGACGTQYLPRLVGGERALEILTLDELVGAVAAEEMGLIDEIAEGDLLEAATAMARRAAGNPPRRTRDSARRRVDKSFYEEFARRHARKFRGLDAPAAIIAAVRAATELPFEEGVRREREIYLKLRCGSQQQALRYALEAERAASRIPELEATPVRQIAKAGVVGSGTMGSGIAIALLGAGIPVTLFERDGAALDRGMAHIRRTMEANVSAGKMAQAQADAALSQLSPVKDMMRLSDADIVIEAAYETIEVKREIFAALDQVVRQGAILATNTSYLDIDEIASATQRPEDVIGLHFFSPANVMKLLEIVHGKATSAGVIATAFALANRIGKVAVLSGNSWGFIGNRMLAVRRKHAEAMAVDGASPAQIDNVIEKFGMAMGPFRVGDLAGLDLGWNGEASSGSTIRERLCEAGRRGQKSGAGFYDYDEDGRPSASNEAIRIIAEFASDNGIMQRSIDDNEVLDRLLWPMVDEGAKILAEGIALRESDIDVVWLNGYGWPRWTGGPMFHARQTGIGEVVRRLEAMGLGASDTLKSLALDEFG